MFRPLLNPVSRTSKWTFGSAPLRLRIRQKEVVAQLAGWFTAAKQDAELRAKLVIQEIYPSGPCGAEFATYIRRQYDDYDRVIREANINAE